MTNENPLMQKTKWADMTPAAREAKVKELLGHGLSQKQIAEALSINATTMSQFIAAVTTPAVHRWNIMSTALRKSTIAGYRVDGLSWGQIAAKFGIDPKTLGKWRAKHGFLRSKKRGRARVAKQPTPTSDYAAAFATPSPNRDLAVKVTTEPLRTRVTLEFCFEADSATIEAANRDPRTLLELATKSLP